MWVRCFSHRTYSHLQAKELFQNVLKASHKLSHLRVTAYRGAVFTLHGGLFLSTHKVHLQSNKDKVTKENLNMCSHDNAELSKCAIGQLSTTKKK